MAEGPGKYDSLCTYVREKVNAEGAIIIVLNGDRGSGFSIQASPEATAKMPEILQQLLNQIRASTLGSTH